MGPLSPSLSILIYHRVAPEPDPLLPDVVSARDFDWQVQALARWFNVLPLRDAVERLRAGDLPPRAACLTFDDGYADNVEIAFPILVRRGVCATFFVSTQFLSGGRMWNDSVIETVRQTKRTTLDAAAVGLGSLDISNMALRRMAVTKLLSAIKYLPSCERRKKVDELAASNPSRLPVDLMMTESHVKGLWSAGMDIGAHTVSHPILARVDPIVARNEIQASKGRLEEITGAKVDLFAYPNGKPGNDYLREHVGMVKDLGFSGAVSTAWGVARMGCDLFQLPRFTPWDRTPGKFVIRLLCNTFRRDPRTV